MTKEEYLQEKLDVVTEAVFRLTQIISIDSSYSQMEQVNEFAHQFVDIIADLNKEYKKGDDFCNT